MKKLLLLLLAFFYLSAAPGCLRDRTKKDPGSAATVGTIEDLKPKINLLETTIAQLRSTHADRISKIGASAQTAGLYTEKLPESDEQRVIKAEVKVISQEVGPDAVKPEDALEATNRALLLYQGKYEEANAAYRQAELEAKQRLEEKTRLEGELSKATAALHAAQAQLVKEQTQSAKEIAAMRAAYEKEIQKLKDAELKKQQWILRSIGALCILASIGLGVAAGGPTPSVLKRSAVLVPSGMLCFAAAQMIAKTWFLPVFYGVCALMVLTIIGVIIWVAREATSKQREARKAEANAALLNSTVTKIAKAGDDLWDNADPELRKKLEEAYFARLGTEMNDPEKAAVHLARASDKLKRVVPAVETVG